jgi:hypothetical protein
VKNNVETNVSHAVHAYGWNRDTAVKIKVKFTLEQATKAQRRSRVIALLFP